MPRGKGIGAAVAVAERYAGIDGAHHKQWVIDQMLRAMLDDMAYQEFVSNYTTGPNGEEGYYDWDTGIAP